MVPLFKLINQRTFNKRTARDIEEIKKTNEKLFNNKRRTFTKN